MGKYIQTSNSERYRKLVCESLCIREHFPRFQTRIVGSTSLVCRGNLQVTEIGQVYRVEVELRPWNEPVARVLRPEIKYDLKAHMYKNGNLCLYDWREQPWDRYWHLHQKFIPWLAEWLLFYELYQLTGKWLGRSALHTTEKSPAPVDAGENN